MEYRENVFQGIPFYMTYPMQNLYLTEMEYEKDMERMKELYPKEVKLLQKMVERRCDEMEFEGSRMYDENPDRMMLEKEANRLMEEFLSSKMMLEEDEMSAQQYGQRNHYWLESLIRILFHDEIYRRRCRYRRCSRWW